MRRRNEGQPYISRSGHFSLTDSLPMLSCRRGYVHLHQTHLTLSALSCHQREVCASFFFLIAIFLNHRAVFFFLIVMGEDKNRSCCQDDTGMNYRYVRTRFGNHTMKIPCVKSEREETKKNS